MSYTVITNNDGELDSKIVKTRKNIEKVCRDAYKDLLDKYEDLDECQIDDWYEFDKDICSMGATIDYCMGHEYVYEVSVKVKAD